jgi:hypothetical protein
VGEKMLLFQRVLKFLFTCAADAPNKQKQANAYAKKSRDDQKLAPSQQWPMVKRGWQVFRGNWEKSGRKI